MFLRYLLGIVLISGVLFILCEPKKKTVYFYPGFFSIEDSEEVYFYGKNLSAICKEKGLKLKVTRSLKDLKDVHKIIIFDLEGYKAKVLSQYSPSQLILFLFEPPTTVKKNYKKKYHSYFSKVYTWDDDLVDGKKYFKFFIPELRFFDKDLKSFVEKKLVTLIARNKNSNYKNELYTKRIETIRFFEKKVPLEFDFYGEGWKKENFICYRGKLQSKEILKNYKFALCYENTEKIKGYITEKIFDCFYYGCVPIYLGASNVEKYIPKKCFIDLRDFSSYDELLVFLKNIKEEEYLQYLKAIEEYLKSPQADIFTPQYFLKIFQEVI
jgi:alpha(1,3/1,4) fucosyltransferase